MAESKISMQITPSMMINKGEIDGYCGVVDGKEKGECFDEPAE